MRATRLLLASLICYTLTCFLFVATAFAQVVAPVAPVPQSAGEAFISTAAVPIAGALVTILVALGAWLVKYLQARSVAIDSSTSAALAETLGAKALTIMMTAVRDTFAKMSPAIAVAAADGKLTPEEAAKLRTDTVAAFLAALGDSFKSQLMGGLGLSVTGLETTYAGGLLEQALNTIKVDKAKELAVRAAAEAQVAQSNAAQAHHEKTTAELVTNITGNAVKMGLVLLALASTFVLSSCKTVQINPNAGAAALDCAKNAEFALLNDGSAILIAAASKDWATALLKLVNDIGPGILCEASVLANLLERSPMPMIPQIYKPVDEATRELLIARLRAFKGDHPELATGSVHL